MTYSLIVSDTGNIMLQSNRPFAADVARLEYYKDSHLIMIGYTDPQLEPEMVPTEISAVFTDALSRGGTALVVHIDEDDKPINGFEVPIISIG